MDETEMCELPDELSPCSDCITPGCVLIVDNGQQFVLRISSQTNSGWLQQVFDALQTDEVKKETVSYPFQVNFWLVSWC